MFKNNLTAQNPLFAHPMGPPSIVPLISPDLMVKTLPPPPPSIFVVSNVQAAMNLNPDVPEFVPRNGDKDSKTEENCDTNDCEQTKEETEINSNTRSDELPVTSNKTTIQHSKSGKTFFLCIYHLVKKLFFFVILLLQFNAFLYFK